MGAVKANNELKLIDNEITNAIVTACQELMDGKHTEHFPIDLVQGGAGTSVNMNANEVIANRALEILGKNRGEYEFCHPNDHVNMAQSTKCIFQFDLFKRKVNVVKVQTMEKVLELV